MTLNRQTAEAALKEAYHKKPGPWADMPPEDKEFMRVFVHHAFYDDYDKLVQLCD